MRAWPPRPPGLGLLVATARNSYRAMLAFYLPLAAAQMLQGIRNPVLDAGVSRGLDPETSLAAFGVVGSLIQLLGAAGIVIQSAFLVLVRGSESYRFFRRYAAVYTVFVLILAALAATPVVGEAFFQYAMGASPDLVDDVMPIMRVAMLVPVFSLIRIFYYAELVHKRQTQVIWLAPAVGETLMAIIALAIVPQLPIAAGIGAGIAWLIVSIAEAAIMVWFARRAQRVLPYAHDPAGERALDMRYATAFALPLVITQFTLAAGTPLAAAGILRLDNPEQAVAAYRVAFSLVMLTLGPLASLRQVALVMAREPQDHARGRNFCMGASFAIFGVIALMAYTPLNRFILGTVIGAPASILDDAIPALQIFALFPLFMGWRQFYAAMSMHQHKTVQVAMAAASRLGVIVVVVFIAPVFFPWSGAWLGAAGRTIGMAAEAGANYAFGRRHFGQAPVVRHHPAGHGGPGPLGGALEPPGAEELVKTIPATPAS